MDEELIFKMIDRRMDMLQDHVMHGRTPDYPTYRHLVGAYSELMALREDIKSYLRALDQDPVDDSQ